MKKIQYHFPIFLILYIIMCSSLIFSQKRYFKGNTHCHSYPNSGDITDTSYNGPNIVSQYKAKGYDFIVFTDHGAWWNAKVLSLPDFTVINGSEPGISGSGRWGHFTGVNLKKRISGSGLTHQQMIDAINNQNAVPFINHPRYSQIPITALQIINDMKNGLFHQEIYNGTTVSEPGPDDISVWDSVLTTGRLMYGVASDDSHRISHQGKGWIMVKASSIQEDTLTEAIRKGDFYASTGVELDSIYYSSKKIFVRSKNGEVIKFIGKEGSLLKQVNGSEGEYDIKGSEIYVRAEISNSSGKKAWIQPYMIIPQTGIAIPIKETKNPDYVLYQNYPNPFNPETVISFHLPVLCFVNLKVFDILGKEVITLFNGEKEPGFYKFEFNGSKLAGGIYYYSLQAGSYMEVKKMILLN